MKLFFLTFQVFGLVKHVKLQHLGIYKHKYYHRITTKANSCYLLLIPGMNFITKLKCFRKKQQKAAQEIKISLTGMT